MVETRTVENHQIRAYLARPILFGRSLGAPIYWDPDPPKSGGSDGQPSDQPADTAPPEKTYTQSELDQKLRGQGKKLEELTAELEKFRTKENQRSEQEQKRKREEAEKRGEFETLYAEATQKAKDYESQLAEMNKRYTGLEALLKEEVTGQLQAVEDKAMRKRWESLLDGKPVLEQRKLLGELLNITGLKSAAHTPGPNPGPPKNPTPDEISTVYDDNALRNAGVAALREFRAKHGLK